MIAIPVENKLTLTIEEAAAYSNIGEHKIRELLKMPKCPFILFVGKKQLIKRVEFEKFILQSIDL